MSGELHQAKRPVSPMLAGPYGHPLHPALVAVPIGAWVASLLFDLGSQIVAEPGFLARGSLWLIGIGVLAAAAAALVGFLDLLGLAAGSRVHRIALVHMAVNLTVTAGYIAAFLWRRSADLDAPVGWGQLALSVLCLAGLAVGGFLGGELSFRYGVRVADEADQAAAHAPDRTNSRR